MQRLLLIGREGPGTHFWCFTGAFVYKTKNGSEQKTVFAK